MSRSVAIFDLDHGMLTRAPGTLLAAELGSVPGRILEGLHGVADAAAGPVAGELAVRALVRTLGGRSVDSLRDAGHAAARRARDVVAPHARPLMAEHRAAGRRLVGTTHLPRPAAEALGSTLGLDAVVATGVGERDGRLTGSVDGPVVWGRGKLLALREWCAQNGASLRRSWCYAGSLHDAPLLAEVGRPVVCDPDPRLASLAWLTGWPARSLRVPEGVPLVAGREIQDLVRPFARPELFPFARFRFDGLEHVPADGPAIVCGNHRSYFDVLAVGFTVAQRGRAARGLGKKEVFDVPVAGAFTRWIGGIRVERGTGSDEPLRAAARALEAGELVMIMPEGTIPRGPAFFEPELKGRWGAARLAAMTKAPVIPLGLWGTERVWPRSSRVPHLNPLRRPLVTVRAGPPVELGYGDPDTDTKAVMSAIVDLLPDEARVRREPTPAQLARTYPPGYRGDPSRESTRRPGSDR